MVYRTYIDKNNTIIYGTSINTGRNPIAELYYGGKETQPDYTRHLIYFDVTELQNKYKFPFKKIIAIHFRFEDNITQKFVQKPSYYIKVLNLL